MHQTTYLSSHLSDNAWQPCATPAVVRDDRNDNNTGVNTKRRKNKSRHRRLLRTKREEETLLCKSCANAREKWIDEVYNVSLEACYFEHP